jgi:ribosomal protein L37AE/L43A
MSDSNIPPQFVRTQQEATQFAAAFGDVQEKLLNSPVSEMFAKVKPPFKCKDCKRKITLSLGYKLGKDKVCERCAQAALAKGYQKLKHSEALTGTRLISGAARSVCEQISKPTPESN